MNGGEEGEEKEEVESILLDPTYDWWNVLALFKRVFRSHRFKVTIFKSISFWPYMDKSLFSSKIKCAACIKYVERHCQEIFFSLCHYSGEKLHKLYLTGKSLHCTCSYVIHRKLMIAIFSQKIYMHYQQ